VRSPTAIGTLPPFSTVIVVRLKTRFDSDASVRSCSAVAPRSTVGLEHFIDRSLSEWLDAIAQSTPVELELCVADHLAAGVVDRFRIVVYACPVVQVPGHAGQWRIPSGVLDESSPNWAQVHPASRTYRVG
jgi:hypothetical protein